MYSTEATSVILHDSKQKRVYEKHCEALSEATMKGVRDEARMIECFGNELAGMRLATMDTDGETQGVAAGER